MSKPLATKVSTSPSENVSGRLEGVFGVVIMLEYCPAAQSPKGGDHALLQYVTVYVGIHCSLNEL